jgi:hypothetical protein
MKLVFFSFSANPFPFLFPISFPANILPEKMIGGGGDATAKVRDPFSRLENKTVRKGKVEVKTTCLFFN